MRVSKGCGFRPDRIRFTVRLERGRLFNSRSGEFWHELIPVPDTRFKVEGHAEVQFSFVTDGDGAALLSQRGCVFLCL